MVKRGKFIVIEGLDGSGSTSQVNLLVDFLKLSGIKTFSTKEPTDNVIGGLLRGALTGVYKLPNVSMQLLFSADRGHHLSRVIEPKLNDGITVVCDRYMWSTVAFGSIDVDRDWLWEMQKYFLKPDLTIFLKADPAECIRKIVKDRYDTELFEDEQKLRKVWSTYEYLAKKYPKDIKVVDSEVTEKATFEGIMKHIRPLMAIILNRYDNRGN